MPSGESDGVRKEAICPAIWANWRPVGEILGTLGTANPRPNKSIVNESRRIGAIDTSYRPSSAKLCLCESNLHGIWFAED